MSAGGGSVSNVTPTARPRSNSGRLHWRQDHAVRKSRACRRRHLHPDSDEVAHGLGGEITLMTGSEVTARRSGTCAFLPRGVPHAGKTPAPETGRMLFLHILAGAGVFFRND